jgi:hypothetical protein
MGYLLPAEPEFIDSSTATQADGSGSRQFTFVRFAWAKVQRREGRLLALAATLEKASRVNQAISLRGHFSKRPTTAS